MAAGDRRRPPGLFLRIFVGEVELDVRELRGERLVLGTDRRCDLPLVDADLEPDHLHLVFAGHGLLLLPSEHALVRCNGLRVEAGLRIGPGDELRLGRHRLVVEQVELWEDLPAPDPPTERPIPATGPVPEQQTPQDPTARRRTTPAVLRPRGPAISPTLELSLQSSLQMIHLPGDPLPAAGEAPVRSGRPRSSAPPAGPQLSSTMELTLQRTADILGGSLSGTAVPVLVLAEEEPPVPGNGVARAPHTLAAGLAGAGGSEARPREEPIPLVAGVVTRDPGRKAAGPARSWGVRTLRDEDRTRTPLYLSPSGVVPEQQDSQQDSAVPAVAGVPGNGAGKPVGVVPLRPEGPDGEATLLWRRDHRERAGQEEPGDEPDAEGRPGRGQTRSRTGLLSALILSALLHSLLLLLPWDALPGPLHDEPGDLPVRLAALLLAPSPAEEPVRVVESAGAFPEPEPGGERWCWPSGSSSRGRSHPCPVCIPVLVRRSAPEDPAPQPAAPPPARSSKRAAPLPLPPPDQPPPAPEPRPGQEERRKLARKLILDGLRSLERQIRGCYNRTRWDKPQLEGRIEARFVVNRQGRVEQVQLDSRDLRDPQLLDCIDRLLRTMRFPAYWGEEIPYSHSIPLMRRREG